VLKQRHSFYGQEESWSLLVRLVHVKLWTILIWNVNGHNVAYATAIFVNLYQEYPCSNAFMIDVLELVKAQSASALDAISKQRLTLVAEARGEDYLPRGRDAISLCDVSMPTGTILQMASTRYDNPPFDVSLLANGDLATAIRTECMKYIFINDRQFYFEELDEALTGTLFRISRDASGPRPVP